MKHQLLAFQLENYDSLRFLKFIYRHPRFWLQGGERQELVWTNKAKGIYILSLLLCFLILGYIIVLSPLQLGMMILAIILVIICSPFFLILSNFLLFPLDLYLKTRTIQKAKAKLQCFPNLQIIGITGSYGKTSTKEVLATILKEKYQVLTTEGNKNTPLGISDIILRELSEHHEVFIVEMGAYKKGNIKELCDLVHPKVGILTGITYQHLERFGSLENIIDAKFELIESLPENGLAIIDTSGENTKTGIQQKKENFKVKDIVTIDGTSSYTYLENVAGIEFEYAGKTLRTKLLAPHSINTIMIAYETATHLGMSDAQIESGITHIDYTEHRMQPIYNPHTNVWVIDDSYNGNLEGVKSTVTFLKNIQIPGRKLYLSPGLTELGEKTKEVHREIGKLLVDAIDMALIIENTSSKYIIESLLETGFPETNIIRYSDTSSAHNDLGNILKSGDLIVFQNDWTDNYF